MFAAIRHPSFLGILEMLQGFGLAAVFRRPRVGADAREGKADVDRRDLRTHDELGLLSGDGCVTDWGLLERAERLRSGWS